MIAVALLLQAASAPMLGAIGKQALPATGCAAYLWSVSDRTLVAMASADPASLRIALDGHSPVDLPRSEQHGAGGFGLAATTAYRGGDIAATLDITVAMRGDLKDGATVPQATLRVEQAGRDEVIVPLGGLIGCKA